MRDLDELKKKLEKVIRKLEERVVELERKEDLREEYEMEQNERRD